MRGPEVNGAQALA